MIMCKQQSNNQRESERESLEQHLFEQPFESLKVIKNLKKNKSLFQEIEL